MNKYYVALFTILVLTACATKRVKYSADVKGQEIDVATNKEISHTFFLIGDAGLSPMGGMNAVLKSFRRRLQQSDQKNSTVLFLGDNIYPAGLPDPVDSTLAYREAKNNLDAQIKSLEGFSGNKYFIPGNHDWYTEGLVGLERQQKYIQRALDSKEVFFPEDGCPMKTLEINDDVLVVAIDTEWYLTNWDKRPDINDKCDIKDRDKFFEEVESIIKKNRHRTVILAPHHPMFSYGSHGGQYSFRQQFYPGHGKIPLPVLGSFINLLRKSTGASIEDLQNKRYRELRERLITLAQYSDKVIFASGHEHTLQYIEEENVPQIVSGAGSKNGNTRLLNGSKFSTGEKGYAVLEVYKDGSSMVRYYHVGEDEKEVFLFRTQVLPPDVKVPEEAYPDHFPATVMASVYTDEEVKKSKFFKSIWGERYRKYYGTKVKVPTVALDTMYGGLTPVRMGGGHQSRSLRLQDKNGKEYVMRALKKSAELYLQSMAFKNQYIVGDFEDTFTEDIFMDFYTGAHPYAPFTVGGLSDAIDLYHTNPTLYYIPKQKALGEFNVSFGNELYMIEEHVSDDHDNLKSFGYTKKIESTDDLMEKLRDDEKYKIDEAAYVRARLFDMLVGDWDRHTDQWRWAEFKDKEGNRMFKPIPRDRDQVYSIMGDGPLLGMATRIVPGLRLMEGFNEEIRSVKGFNSSPKAFALDLSLLSETTISTWEKQAAYIQEHITPDVIDKALQHFPEEVQDETVGTIKQKLLSRKANLLGTAQEYYKILNRFSVVSGTDKDDYFVVNSLENGEKEVTGYRIKGGEKADVFFHKVYDKEYTKEIWIYGLDDDDIFEVNSTDNTIKVRLVGGQNKDTYIIPEGKGTYVYDFKRKNNIYDEAKKAHVRKLNDYETNNYQFSKIKASVNEIIPTIGYNPDDGVRLGFQNVYTFNGFRQNPFTQQHTVNAAFYFATSGFDIGYKGEYANLFGRWNFELAARSTSANFSINFFGMGNETPNPDDDLGLDYNRVRTEIFKVAPSLLWRSPMGAKFRVGVLYESIEVEETDNRFINTFYVANGEENEKKFVGVDAEYTYENKDNNAFPTLGMATTIELGYKKGVSNTDNGFGYIIPSIAFDYKLIPSGKLVLATKVKSHFTIGDNYEFYQAATLGASDGLRGFRNQRFSGKKAFYQNTDIRYSLKKMKTNFLPVAMGVFGGFDYGRVWLPTESSEKWHTSYGGGFFLNGADVVTAKFSLFESTDGLRFAFGLGFGF